MKLYCHIKKGLIEVTPKTKTRKAKYISPSDRLTCKGIKQGVAEVKKYGRGNHKSIYIPLSFLEFYANMGKSWGIFEGDFKQTV